jgi:hypothetical protein
MATTTIDNTIWQQPVTGLNLTGAALAEQLDDKQPTLLVFLRHFG